jgi:hypothetical protein
MAHVTTVGSISFITEIPDLKQGSRSRCGRLYDFSHGSVTQALCKIALWLGTKSHEAKRLRLESGSDFHHGPPREGLGIYRPM